MTLYNLVVDELREIIIPFLHSLIWVSAFHFLFSGEVENDE